MTQETRESTVEHSIAPGRLTRALLARYSLADVDAAVRWLEVGEYVGYTGFGMIAPKMLIYLTPKGVELAEAGELSGGERDLLYQEDPYSVFVARQFRDEDRELFEHLRDVILAPLGLTGLDGTVDGIEGFRGEILRKIRRARYFVCILTKRDELASGGFASSVWLYQETGAAVALGKKPIVLVEEDMHEHYAGELQKNYEYVPFQRAEYEGPFGEVGRRIAEDLRANDIPLRS